MSKDGPIYKKYHVERTDGESGPNGKHQFCKYFVLDMNCDPYAVTALRAYADACQETHPTLAADIRSRLPELGATENVKWRDASALRDRIRQLEAERDTAWNDAIEAAAKYHDEIFKHDSQGIEYSTLVGIPISNLSDLEESCRKAEMDAAAIRALKKGDTP